MFLIALIFIFFDQYFYYITQTIIKNIIKIKFLRQNK